MNRVILGILAAALIGVADLGAQNVERRLVTGESLLYTVSFFNLELGEVRLNVLEKTRNKGERVLKTEARITSYPTAPVTVDHHYLSYLGDPDHFSRLFQAWVFKEGHTFQLTYDFDYNRNRVRVEKGTTDDPGKWADSSGAVSSKMQDGVSIFYFARMGFGERRSVDVPCFANEAEFITTINYYTKPEPVEIDAIGYPVECVKLDGALDFTSVFGLTGEFEGLFTNDEAAIPLVAYLNVWLGVVRLELVEWERPGWTPPPYDG
jgi:hypothetical protein